MAVAAAPPPVQQPSSQHLAFLTSWKANVAPKLAQMLQLLQQKEVATSFSIAQVLRLRPTAHHPAAAAALAVHHSCGRLAFVGPSAAGLAADAGWPAALCSAPPKRRPAERIVRCPPRLPAACQNA